MSQQTTIQQQRTQVFQGPLPPPPYTATALGLGTLTGLITVFIKGREIKPTHLVADSEK